MLLGCKTANLKLGAIVPHLDTVSPLVSVNCIIDRACIYIGQGHGHCLDNVTESHYQVMVLVI